MVHRVPAWHARVRKQRIKAPKVHLLDSGLACNLLGIRSPEELRHHPLRGAVFESWVPPRRTRRKPTQAGDRRC